jgi:hypothetical protein
MWESSGEHELKLLLQSAYRHIDWLHKQNLSSAKAEAAICHLQGEVYVRSGASGVPRVQSRWTAMPHLIARCAS